MHYILDLCHTYMVMQHSIQLKNCSVAVLVAPSKPLDHQNCKWLPVLGFLACFTRKTGELRNAFALVTKLEKIWCTYFGPKTFRGCWTFIHYIHSLHCMDYFPCYLGCNLLFYFLCYTLLTPGRLKPATFRAWGVG